MKTYVPLHTHDTYGSIGDSILKIPDYISKAKSLGLKSLALTNHGSMSSFLTFYEECRKNDIKPIIGCEFYIVDDISVKDKEHKQCCHLILLAENYNGLQNLIRIHNISHSDGFYYKPRIDLSILKKYHKDLVCLTACIGSPLAKAYLAKDYSRMVDYTIRLKNIFGRNLFLELQPGRFKDQVNYNDALIRLSRLGIDLVVSNDIHMLDKKDCTTHNYHVRDYRQNNTGAGFVYPDSVYYLMSREELENSFVYTDLVTKDIVTKALDNTNRIAKKCSLEMPDERFMPVFDKDINEYAALEKFCLYRLKELGLKSKPEYYKRLYHELDTIRQLGFSGYFLIVKDICDYCDIHDIARGPGRGSGAGSLVSYLLKISVADPIKYKDLMFERFLSPKRTGLPDIDLDIMSEKKAEVYDYIIQKYGPDHCCFVSTFNMRKARAAIKAACRLLNVDIKTSNIISQSIPYVIYDEMGDKHTEISIDDALKQIPDFARLAKKYPDIIRLAKSIENYPCSVGIHPAGIIVSPVDISARYPLIKAKDKPICATSLDLSSCEKLGGVKFDLLSLSSLSVISKTMKDCNFTFDYKNDKLLHDEKVWELISSESSAGLFQISSNVYKTRMPQLHPKSIEELAACLALVRGPCISNKMDERYINIINGKEKPDIIHPLYWEVTKNTHGILIYQEQVLKLLMTVGFDVETSYKILKLISKKKRKEILIFQQEFYSKCRNSKIPNEIAERIWSILEASGLYAFNVAHATSYALLCYASAYLKTYFTTEYMANLLTKEYCKASSDINIDAIMEECRIFGIKFLPPDINRSNFEFTVEDDKIRFGLCSIKGLGKAAAARLEEFEDIPDFNWFVENVAGRVINKKIVLLLIAAGCFDEIHPLTSRDELAEYYMTRIRKDKYWDGTIKIGNDKDSVINISVSNTKLNTKLLQTNYCFG